MESSPRSMWLDPLVWRLTTSNCYLPLRASPRSISLAPLLAAPGEK